MSRKQTEHIENDQKSQPYYMVDAHIDLPYYMMNQGNEPSFKNLETGPFTVEKAAYAGIRLFCTALYCEDRFNGDGSSTHFRDILGFTLKALDSTGIIKDKDDFSRLSKYSDKPASLLLIENADFLAGNLSYIEMLKENGIRIVGLTHAGTNRLADGNSVLYPNGITDQGRDVIRAIHKNGLIIDVAHLHPDNFWQLLKIYEGPMISSHTGIRTFCNIPRNIDLDQAGEIIGMNGVIGISFNPEMLSIDGNAKVEDIFIHIDVLVQKFGPNGVGIGSDFCGFNQATEGMEDISRIKSLVDIMLEHGYGEEAARKIMGLNWLRFYEKMFE